MSFPQYQNVKVECTKPVDTANLKGKSVVITGGGHGMGEQSVTAFVKAGAFVTFGDVNEVNGTKLEAELGLNAKFVRCDVSSWESQRDMFKIAKSSSPHQSVDVVVACAGISGADPVFYGQDGEEPSKPDLKIMDVNCTGVIYTLSLARFYFLKSPPVPDRDRCFIVFSSAAGYVDVPGAPLYQASKYAARSLMSCMRRTTFVDGIRACALAPWYVETGLMSSTVLDFVKSRGVKFADAADAAGALLKIASDSSINGRCFAIVPREEGIAPFGYYDFDNDDFTEGSRAFDWQHGQLKNSHRLQAAAGIK